MARFSERMVTDVVQQSWAALARGELFITDAAAEIGTYRKKGTRWVAAAGGVRHPRHDGLERFGVQLGAGNVHLTLWRRVNVGRERPVLTA